jgi:glutamyl-tRNA synthetase
MMKVLSTKPNVSVVTGRSSSRCWSRDRCYCTKEELDRLRADQIARGEKPRYDGRWRDRNDARPGVEPAIRFKNPLDGEVVVEDVVHGPVVFRNGELDDLIIARSDGTPTYNFCVVVDDMDMRITHVIRGDDHLNNSPRQVNMLRALGYKPPVYAHLPMILGSDGAKLSKRHGAVSVLQYRDDGFLPEALLNYLVRLGWSYGDREIFSIDEMIAHFELADVNRSASAFNFEKLLWLNQQHMMRCDPARLVEPLRRQLESLGVHGIEDNALRDIAIAQRERAKTVKEMAHSSLYFFKPPVAYEDKAVRKHVNAEILRALDELVLRLAALDDWSTPAIHALVSGFATEKGMALGICGATVSPPIDTTPSIVGRTETLARIAAAIHAWRQ